MKLVKPIGATSEIWQLFIRDSSSSTGAGLTGLTNASSGLTAYYHRDTDTTATAISLASMTIGTFTSSGFKEIDATNMPGWYQFCPPNAALATGAKSCGFHLKGATNMAPLPIEVQLTAGFSFDDAVRAGLTALPNAAAEAAGGLYTRGTGAGQINQPANGSIDSNTKTWNGLTTVALPLVPTTAGRTLDVSSTGEAGVDWANVGSPTTTVGLTGTTISTGQVVASVTGAVGSVTGAVGSVTARVTANTDQLAGQTVTAAAGVTFPASVASPTNITAGTITTVTNLTNAATAGDLTATMKASVVAAAWDTAIAGHVTSGSTGEALSNAGSAGDPWSTALPGAYGAGTAGHIVGTALPDIAPGSANGLLRGGTNAATSITTALTANIIGNVTGNLSGSVGSVTGAVGSVTGAVGSVTGNVGGNVVGSVASVTAGVTVTTNNDKTGYRLSATGVDDVWDEVVDTGSVTGRQSLRLANSANGAKLSGAATTTVLIRDLADTKDRVTATVDSSGDRTAVSLDLT